MSLFFEDDGRVFMTYGSGDIKITELTRDAYYVGSVWLICVPTRGCFTCRLPNANFGHSLLKVVKML
jgi:hypothetical protein